MNDRLIEGDELSEEQIRMISGRPVRERYSFFVASVARSGELWAIRDSDSESWLTMPDDDGAELLPVWSHRDFAEQQLKTHIVKNRPKSMVDKMLTSIWLSQVLPAMENYGDKAWVFPAGEFVGAIVAPLDLKRDIESELDRLTFHLQSSDLASISRMVRKRRKTKGQ